MSYLNRLRLHFAGNFQAAVSTVNNDPTHYDNSTFNRETMWRTDPEGNTGSPDGWWNPLGDASWRFLGVQVTSAYDQDGNLIQQDEVLTCLIGDNDRSAPAKMADLDPEQQMVSTIWGWEVRIVNRAGQTLLRGKFKAAPFADVWKRSSLEAPPANQRFSALLGAMYQSVLTDLEWGDISNSSFLQHLKATTEHNKLSMKFNLDGYLTNYQLQGFTQGRVVGTIGPFVDGEPDHFVIGRELFTVLGSLQEQSIMVNTPATAVVDEAAGKVLLDVGNALQTAGVGGSLTDIGELSLLCQDLQLGTIPYQQAGWYEKTAGILELPADRSLTPDELKALSNNPLTLNSSSGTSIPEQADGLYVRADQFVHRMNPGDTAQTRVYATKFGKPYPNATITLNPYNGLLQGSNVGTPADALQYPATIQTGADGTATFAITGSNPKNPRGCIDGQVYGIQPLLEGMQTGSTQVKPYDFISILLWDEFGRSEHPLTWHDTMKPIFEQYANLYPVMQRFFDLGNYDQVCNNRELLLLAFTLEEDNPNSMPVTRDLSRAKRDAIVSWLKDNLDNNGNPQKGEPKQVSHTASDETVNTPELQAVSTDNGEETTSKPGTQLLFEMKSGKLDRLKGESRS